MFVLDQPLELYLLCQGQTLVLNYPVNTEVIQPDMCEGRTESQEEELQSLFCCQVSHQSVILVSYEVVQRMRNLVQAATCAGNRGKHAGSVRHRKIAFGTTAM